MRKWLVGIGWLCVLWLAGCKDDGVGERLLARAEAVFATAPDSARALLDSVALPEELGDRALTRWCTLYGRVADTLYIDLPYPEPFRQAYAYLRAHGARREQARMGLYLGRAYAADKEYERAMKVYLQALDAALACEDYNQAGYISSYTADLYDFEENYLRAKEKYAEAATYFERAGNRRSQAFAYRDVGRMYVFADSARKALPYILRADTILTTVGDSSDIAYIANALGNTYVVLNKIELAKKYLWKSISLSDSDNAPDYTALAGIYIDEGSFDKARICLKEAQKLPILNKRTHSSIIYEYYKLEKAEGHKDIALNYLEEYKEASDSLMILQNKENIIEAEKKYEHIKVSLENAQLKVHRLTLQILLAICFSFCLGLLSIYFIVLNRKNKKIYLQQINLERLNNQLLRLQEALSRIQKELQESQAEGEHREEYERLKVEESALIQKLTEQRKALLLSSAIGKKLRKLSQKVVPGNTQSLLTEKDWKTICATVNDIYPTLEDTLNTFGMTSTESRYCYLSLFQLDTTEEAILLNIQPDSVNKRRQRVRQKLGITGKEVDLRRYLINLL